MLTHIPTHIHTHTDTHTHTHTHTHTRTNTDFDDREITNIIQYNTMVIMSTG